jgi:long-chain acyl-CoA synthetase
LHEALRRTARARPDAVAVSFHGRDMTFAELDSDSSRLAHAFIGCGVGPGDRVGLFAPNCPEFETAFYAASKAGAVSCPINPSYRERELAHIMADARLSLVVTTEALAPIVETARAAVGSTAGTILIGGAGSDSLSAQLRGLPASSPEVDVDPGQLAVLPYSSGTTGLPKGVRLTHRNVVTNHHQFIDASAIAADDVLMVFLPLTHIYGILLMGVACTAGARQVLLERFDLSEVVRLVEEERVTWLFGVPPVMLALANAPGLAPAQFSSLRFVMSAAAPLAPEVGRRVAARLDVRVMQAYGLTEASPATHFSPLDPARIRLDTCGVPIADTECRVVDLETGDRDLPAGEIGEVAIRGPQVMEGYWDAPAETARVLRRGWLHTGDIGMVDDAGYLTLVDRKKEMIKYKGFSIAPSELEAALLEHPDVVDCAVVGVADAEAGEVPRGFIVPRDGCVVETRALEAHMSRRLAGFKQIRSWQIVASIPRTPSGKILRRLLRDA